MQITIVVCVSFGAQSRDVTVKWLYDVCTHVTTHGFVKLVTIKKHARKLWLVIVYGKGAHLSKCG